LTEKKLHHILWKLKPEREPVDDFKATKLIDKIDFDHFKNGDESSSVIFEVKFLGNETQKMIISSAR
jgi:hypothetical protein